MGKSLIPVETLLDNDLAKMYGVATGQLIRQVKRNLSRFPEDYCFQLTPEQLGQHDEQFRIVFEAIRQLMAEPEPPPKRKIGYRAET